MTEKMLTGTLRINQLLQYMEFCIFFRFFFKSNDSILGATSSNSLKVPEKPDVSSRPRIKVHASQRKAAQRQQSQSTTTQPLVNGDRVEEDSLMYISDISAIHDTRSNNLPGLSKKVSIGNFSVSVYGLFEPQQDKNLIAYAKTKMEDSCTETMQLTSPFVFAT